MTATDQPTTPDQLATLPPLQRQFAALTAMDHHRDAIRALNIARAHAVAELHTNHTVRELVELLGITRAVVHTLLRTARDNPATPPTG